ncbi:MAG: energy transducer TonB [Verrucomicrobia bacterium]|nr:energy transducer TonB [Verrucomicrobiota bacterium]
MNRDTVIALIAAALVHGGLAASGYFTSDPAPEILPVETPTIALDLPPPPPPDEPEVVEASTEAPAEHVELAPPTQADVPSAVIDSVFVQQVQAPPPPQINRGAGIVIPTATRPGSGDAGLKNIFSLAELDQRLEVRVRTKPNIPYELKRTGLTRAEVVVGFIVDTNGDVREAYIVRSNHSALEEPVLQAVARWKFKPGRRAGVPVNTRVEQLLEFNLQDA